MVLLLLPPQIPVLHLPGRAEVKLTLAPAAAPAPPVCPIPAQWDYSQAHTGSCWSCSHPTYLSCSFPAALWEQLSSFTFPSPPSVHSPAQPCMTRTKVSFRQSLSPTLLPSMMLLPLLTCCRDRRRCCWRLEEPSSSPDSCSSGSSGRAQKLCPLAGAGAPWWGRLGDKIPALYSHF